MLLTRQDFVGELRVATGQITDADFVAVVTAAEERVLTDLLGVALYRSFTQGMEAEEVEARWVKLAYGEVYTYHGMCYHYKGVKHMLKYFAYADLVRLQRFSDTHAGVVENEDVIGSVSKAQLILLIEARVNQGVLLYQDAQRYITRINAAHPGTYPDYITTAKHITSLGGGL
jgi:hypothetical protein